MHAALTDACHALRLRVDGRLLHVAPPAARSPLPACSVTESILLKKFREENGGKDHRGLKVAGHMPGYAANDR